ncbi:hypothetical protein PROFUN_07026 [Planoprotostelium fungivorum]|uniref:Uncharacterized protein n=1 Tax=Planoprotostelium fungivorum TaxID=1890364 RepID=A0A2P6NMQ7_9EUKA|nr:hypothetical protein PROFUN_07026 [Planoprotostelium fungivorum]
MPSLMLIIAILRRFEASSRHDASNVDFEGSTGLHSVDVAYRDDYSPVSSSDDFSSQCRQSESSADHSPGTPLILNENEITQDTHAVIKSHTQQSHHGHRERVLSRSNPSESPRVMQLVQSQASKTRATVDGKIIKITSDETKKVTSTDRATIDLTKDDCDDQISPIVQKRPAKRAEGMLRGGPVIAFRTEGSSHYQLIRPAAPLKGDEIYPKIGIRTAKGGALSGIEPEALPP